MVRDVKRVFDAFGIPDGDRPRWFKINFWSGWSIAGIILYLLIRCSDARVADKEANDLAREKIRQEAEAATQARVDREMYRIMQALEFTKRSLDTANKKLDTIKTSI